MCAFSDFRNEEIGKNLEHESEVRNLWEKSTFLNLSVTLFRSYKMKNQKAILMTCIKLKVSGNETDEMKKTVTNLAPIEPKK